MRITRSQLRRIIKEEARRAMLNEVGFDPAEMGAAMGSVAGGPAAVKRVNQAIVDALCAQVEATDFTGVSQMYLDEELMNSGALGRAIEAAFKAAPRGGGMGGGFFERAATDVIDAVRAPIHARTGARAVGRATRYIDDD